MYAIRSYYVCARIGCAYTGTQQHIRQIDVVCVHCGTKRLVDDFDAADAVTDRTGQFGCGDIRVIAEQLRGKQDRVFNLFITRAAADVVLDGFLDVRTRGVRIQVYQAFCADDHAGRAKTALHGARRRKRIGVDVFFALV